MSLKKYAVPGNPIFFKNKIILGTPNKSLIALDILMERKFGNIN